MCQATPPASAQDALASASAALGWLAAADAAGLTTIEQAEALRALEQVAAQLTAARSAVLAAFTAGRGFEADAAASPVSWLRSQTRVTTAAAAAAAGWTRDLAAHPAIAAALAAGQVSVSWARQLCGWTDRLPAAARPGADQILLDAAAGGARLADLGGLAEELHRATAAPDGDDGGDGFTSRRVRLLTHFRGAGTLDGELTPDCAAALRAVLDALSAKAGPEDTRTGAQRQHDALAEACRRLIAGGLPDRAGQPTQIYLHMTLEQLLGLPGAGQAAADWAGYGATAPPGAACDAAITPIVTGHLDPAELDRQARELLTTASHNPAASHSPGDSEPADSGSQPGPPTASTPDTGSQAWDSRQRQRSRHRHRAGQRVGRGAGRLPGLRRTRPPARQRRLPAAARHRGHGPHRRPGTADHPRHPAAIGPGRAGRPPARRPAPAARRQHQPAARPRQAHRHRPGLPAPRDHRPRQALRLPRLLPAAGRLPDPPPDLQIPGRAYQPGRLLPSVYLPPSDSRPPLGLATAPQPRRHHHRHPRRPRPPQPRTNRRVTRLPAEPREAAMQCSLASR